VKRKCSEAKENWLDKECCEMESGERCKFKCHIQQGQNSVWKKRKAVEAGAFVRKMVCSMLTDCKEICSRWERCIKELFDDVRGEPPKIFVDIVGPEISKDEIRHEN